MKKLILIFTIVASFFITINVFGDDGICNVCSKEVGFFYSSDDYEYRIYNTDNRYEARKIDGKLVSFGKSYIFCNECYDKYHKNFYSYIEHLESKYLEDIISENLENWKKYQLPRDKKLLKTLRNNIETNALKIVEVKEQIKKYGVNPDTFQEDSK